IVCFERRTGRFWIRNTSRKNPTMLRRAGVETPVGEAFVELRSGDTIRLALAEIRFLPGPLKAVRKEPRAVFQRVSQDPITQKTLLVSSPPNDPWASKQRLSEAARRQPAQKPSPQQKPAPLVNPGNDALSLRYIAEAEEIRRVRVF